MDRVEQWQWVSDGEGHVGKVVFVFPETNGQTAYVRWHKGFRSVEQAAELQPASAPERVSRTTASR